MRNPSVRWLLAATVTTVAVGLLTPAAASPSPAIPSHGQHDSQTQRDTQQRRTAQQRAASAYTALNKNLRAKDGSGLYREKIPAAAADNQYSYEWPYSQVHVAALDLAAGDRAYTGEVKQRAAAQEHYWKADGGTTGKPGYASYPIAPYGQGGDFFYDDNEWVGLAKMQWYLQTRDTAALNRARQIFTLVVSGWDTDAAPGGVFWTQAPWSQARNTVSNMPGALLGLRLYQATHDRYYLNWAKRMYDWTNANLQSPSGLYWDNLDLKGTIDKTEWSYNQGVPIGVNTVLYEITGNRTYLRRAERIADAAYTYYVTEKRLLTQPIYFNSIFFKNLLLLTSVNGDPRFAAAMRSYADTVWTQQRDPASGLVHFDADGSTETIQQAALVQLYAQLGWPRRLWSTIS